MVGLLLLLRDALPALVQLVQAALANSTSHSLKFQLRRATLHCWPAGAPQQRIVQHVLNVPEKIMVGPLTHTSLRLQLRRATFHYRPAGALKFQLRHPTLHYWPAGAPQCIVQPVLNVPDKFTLVPSTRRPLSSGTGHARARPELVTVLGVTDCKPLACPLLGNNMYLGFIRKD